MKILITGGAGYVGTLLCETLIKLGHELIVIDTCWFGNFLPKNKKLKLIKKNILDIDENIGKGVQTIIHLASIASDPASELNPKYTWEISCLGTKKLCEIAKKNKIRKFIYASSGSVYGIKKEKKVTEDLSLVPISDYNKTKMIAENVIQSYKKYFKYYLIRPGTVYGYSKRMRLDLMINILCFQALTKKEITILGGNQLRPYIHIKDMVNVYLHFLKRNLKSGAYNSSAGNLSVKKTAQKIKERIDNINVVKKKSNDPRSYRLSSEKLLKTGFKFSVTLKQGVDEIIDAFFNKKIKKTKESFSVNWVKKQRF